MSPQVGHACLFRQDAVRLRHSLRSHEKVTARLSATCTCTDRFPAPAPPLPRLPASGAGIVPPPQPNPALLEKWLLWVQWGAGGIPSHAPLHGRTEMGEAQFVKLLRETGLLDKEGPGALFTSRHADLVYAKVKGKVGRRSASRAAAYGRV